MIITRWIDVPASAHGRAARLAVHLAGTGPLAVLLHGFPLDHRLWLDTLHSPLAATHTLAAIDLRGHGASAWAGDAVHGMELFADDVAAVITALGAKQADVVGLSMGGYVALAFGERHPAMLRTLALVDTKSGADSEAGRAGRDAAMQTVVAQGRRVVAEAMIQKLLPPDSDLLLRARLTTIMESQPAETFVADLRGMRDRVDRTPSLRMLGVPTLVVVGEKDVLTPPSEARAMADALSNARIVIVPDCGHLVPMEAPAAFERELSAAWR